MTVSQDTIDDALGKIDDGLELHIRGRRAWWQMRERSSLRFDEELERARGIIDALADRFRFRQAPVETILTTEPVPGGPEAEDDERADKDDAYLLPRRWVTAQQIADAIGLSKSYTAKRIKSREDELEWRWSPLTSGGGRPQKCYDAYDVAILVEDIWGDTIQVREGLQQEPTIVPKALTLTHEWYSRKMLGRLVRRTKEGVHAAIEKRSDLDITRRRGKKGTVLIRADDALVELLDTAWDIDATIRTAAVREGA